VHLSVKTGRSEEALRTSILTSAHLDAAVVDGARDAEVICDHVFSHVCTLVLQLTSQLSSDKSYPADVFLGFISGNRSPTVGTCDVFLSTFSSFRSPSALALKRHSAIWQSRRGCLDISLPTWRALHSRVIDVKLSRRARRRPLPWLLLRRPDTYLPEPLVCRLSSL